MVKFNLRLIRLTDSKSSLTLVGPPPSEFDVKLNQRLAMIEKQKVAIARTEIVLSAKKDGSSVSIEAAFDSTYDCDSTLSEAELRDKQNEMMADAWPFIREYVFNIGAKMALPAMMLPVVHPEPIRIGPTKKRAKPRIGPTKKRSVKRLKFDKDADA